MWQGGAPYPARPGLPREKSLQKAFPLLLTGGGGAAIIKAVIEAVKSGKLNSAHDISLGGIGAGLARMCKNMGGKVDVSEIAGGMKEDEFLFSEAPARALLATAEPEAVQELLKGVPHAVIGTVGGDALEIKGKDFELSISLEEIKNAHESLTKFMMMG